MKEKAWILVANRERARVYRVIRVGEMEEVIAFIHPEAHKTAQDLESDTYGRGFERMNASRHAYEPKTTAQDKKDSYFAKILSEYLEQECANNSYRNLYIISEPRFLGFLKKELPHQVEERVDKTFTKDLVNQKPDLIWDHVPLVC